MKKAIIITIAVFMVGLGIYYLASNNRSGGPATDTSPTPSVSTSNNPTSIIVSIKNFSFTPGALSIKTGTKVTWVNDDAVTHTVTADQSNVFDSGTLSPGQSFSFTFTNPGILSYHCNIHPMMKGTVTAGN